MLIPILAVPALIIGTGLVHKYINDHHKYINDLFNEPHFIDHCLQCCCTDIVVHTAKDGTHTPIPKDEFVSRLGKEAYYETMRSGAYYPCADRIDLCGKESWAGCNEYMLED